MNKLKFFFAILPFLLTCFVSVANAAPSIYLFLEKDSAISQEKYDE